MDTDIKTRPRGERPPLLMPRHLLVPSTRRVSRRTWSRFSLLYMVLLLQDWVWYLSCERRGLLVWTGVDGPDMSEGVEQGAGPSLWTLLKEP